MTNQEIQKQVQFTKHFAKCEQAMQAFAYSLVPNLADVEDILQNSLSELWMHYDEYDPELPFLPWANRFVYRQVLAHRRKEATRLKYTLSEETMRRLSEERDSQERHEFMVDAVKGCVEKLNCDEQELLKVRYQGSMSIQKIAETNNVSSNLLYKKLQRIRNTLQHCVAGQLMKAGWE